MQDSASVLFEAPSLPNGGGAISGIEGDIAAAGPDGAAALTLPLPISAGRGYAPPLALNYHSRSGNGPFGIGWDIAQSSISLRTQKGVPAYDETDEFIGPEGEVLIPLLATNSNPSTRTATALLGVEPGGSYTVSSWRSRVETRFSKVERWLPQDAAQHAFWVIYDPNGEVHLFGRNAQARISNPQDASQTAVWLHESSVSATGEQIYYQYRAENEEGCDTVEIAAHPGATAQRYLSAVWYGNRAASRTLPALDSTPLPNAWLFTLVLDYGERTTDIDTAPAWLAPGEGAWTTRQDSFSTWIYGFELRTRRLCQQVLMYHAVTALAGNEKTGDVPQLIARLHFDYAGNASLSTLKAARQAAYEPDGKLCALPPLAFGWQSFTPPQTAVWQQRDDMGKLNQLQPYQFVDLNGEGVAGILYQDGGAWWYRAPVRQPGDDADAITWDKASPLPTIPALRNSGMLIDLNGDGYLEWVVTAPGVAGHYDRTPDREWQHFTPLSALPVEYAHARTLQADVTGAGLADLVLIGPKSVRLYCGKGDGWEKAQDVIQSAGINLPVPGTDDRVLVAFSDMAGSGQQHLAEVCARGVRYWPNIGHGRFGAPIDMPGFSQPAGTFNPEQLYLADIDGSGTTDLIYALSDSLLVYCNQSGNRFAAPFSVDLPKGVRYDRTCSLQLADIQGLGVASLVLTTPHPVPRHWVCHLSEHKPWLLAAQNNNMGARHALSYRSSAQFWLDEKADAAAAGKPIPPCYLPFALHTLHRTEITDEITGNRLVSTCRYRHGGWDGREREFRGFGFVEVRDTDTTSASGTAAEIGLPSISRSWYATGLAEIDRQLAAEYWQGDSAAWPTFEHRFTTGSGDKEQAYTPDDTTTFWLNRGLKGTLLRTELFGADNSSQASIPYSVSENRTQVRLIEAKGTCPVIWPTQVESRSWVYERVSSDPQCSQQVRLRSDDYGQPLAQVSINYPRRAQPAASPYTDSLPETLFASSYDDQQQFLRLTLQQNSWYTLQDIAAGIWMPGVPYMTRSDAYTHPSSAVPSAGVTRENVEGLINEENDPILVGQQQVWYREIQNTLGSMFPPLRSFITTAVMEKDTVDALSNYISDTTLGLAGYKELSYYFPRASEEDSKIWSVIQGLTTYGSAEHFWMPVKYSETALTGAITLTRDPNDCVITRVEDAAGLTTTAEYDWRFLTPDRVTDANSNKSSVAVDALGRVTSVRVSGSQNGKSVGYSDAAMAFPATADEALALTAPLPVAQCISYIADSWGPDSAEKLPPHVVTLTTDRYDNDLAQQIRQQVAFNDGFGRALQIAARQADGEAWQRTDDGALVTSTDGAPAVKDTTFRWAVTGRTEYDNKGQPVRTYQPYFLDSWKYVSDDSARQDLYADTYAYDPVGREVQIVTAKGWLRRALYTPWFVVNEDENDTASGEE